MLIKTDIPTERIADMLCSAFEGGSNYWYEITEFRKPRRFDFRTDKEHVFRHIDFPLNPGGGLTIRTLEGEEIGGQKEWFLNLRTIVKGLEVFSSKYPRHYGNFLAEDDDAETGDVFLQCCLFGEAIFG